MTQGADPRPADERDEGRPRRGRSGGRAPLRVRKTDARREAQRRIAVRTRQALTPAQRAFDPLARTRSTTARRAAIALLAILASAGVHLAVVGGAFLSRPGQRVTHDEVKVAIREHEREPEKKPPPPPPPAPIERPARKIAKVAPPPPAPPPVAPPKAKPVRVVGLSLESTMGEGGDGPAFAAGNTRMGEVAEKAVAPREIAGAATGDTKAPASGTGNKLASRIPVAGVKYVPPKRPHQKKPPYPATLKSQGIEADVMVMVSIDATGKVLSVKIIKPSQYPEFDEAARTTALSETWEPALRDDVPIPYTVSYTYRFRLEDQ
jgi:TonB family protein